LYVIFSATERKVKNMIRDVYSGEENKDSIDKDISTNRHACLVCCEKTPDAVLMECGHGGTFTFFPNFNYLIYLIHA